MKILLIDNYDSFTHNLALMIHNHSGIRPAVVFNDKIDLDTVNQFDKIMLSPGPGIPSEAGLLKEVIEWYAPVKSILGICLGHQAIAEVFGAELINLDQVYHGVDSGIDYKIEEPLFKDVEPPFTVGRYHSWAVKSNTLPSFIEIIAKDNYGEIMGIAHKQYDVKGLQFHPESIMTPQGYKLIKNWLK